MNKKDFEYSFATVSGLLKRYPYLYEDACYSGDLSHIDYKIDMDNLIEQAELTPKQKEILIMHYFNGMTQQSIAEELNISQQGVFNSLTGIRKKIERVLSRWNSGKSDK